jgi:hypothetical protein
MDGWGLWDTERINSLVKLRILWEDNRGHCCLLNEDKDLGLFWNNYILYFEKFLVGMGF